MRRMAGWILVLCCAAVPSYGWGNRGHKLVAYLAYIHASSEVQARIDQLVALNPCHDEWQKAVAADADLSTAQDQRAALFMLAATWPDYIKHDPSNPKETHPYDCQKDVQFSKKGDMGTKIGGGESADVAPQIPAACQNIGYSDTRRHQYWHFIDQPYTPDNSKTYPALAPNVVTELDLLSKSLATKNDPGLNSYDLVWIAHLMGDLHQPLHSVAGFSKAQPNGDAGGNLVHICSASGSCSAELHSHWDDLPGADAPPSVIIQQAKKMDTMHGTATAVTADFAGWGKESFEMAKKDAYAKPFDADPAEAQEADMVAAKYDDQAKKAMQSQIVLAGWRLAQVLNTALKNRPDSCCKVAG